MDEQTMSVTKRGEYYHYRFTLNKKCHSGSTYKTTKKEAIAFEKDLRLELKLRESVTLPLIAELLKNEGLVVPKEVVIPHTPSPVNEPEPSIERILIDDVWNEFREDAPAKLVRQPSEKKWAFKEGCWNDFKYFIRKKYPNCKYLTDITEKIAVMYVNHLKSNGRFNKIISGPRQKVYKADYKALAPSTINEYIAQLNQIFNVMNTWDREVRNPFKYVKKSYNKKVSRDVFEREELKLILDFVSDDKSWATSTKPRLDLIINRALVIIGINTGLDRKSISLLKWSHIDLDRGVLEMVRSKTGEALFVPLSKQLQEYLIEQQAKEDSGIYGQYVTPSLARMYLASEHGVSYRFKKMLEHLGINNTKEVEGRSRRVSNKDIHSLRHTFCYLHGINGTPIRVIQSMVGHMTAKMTESYTLHETEESKRYAINHMNDVMESLVDINSK